MVEIGKKVDNDCENFIDYYLVEICKVVSEPLHKLKVTPNMITVFGIFLGLTSIFFLINKNYLLSLVFLWLTYWSDCLDGYFARRYNQITKLGDFLDHFRDLFVCVSVIVLILLQIKPVAAKISFAVVISIFAFLMCYYIGCQEKLTTYTENNDCLKYFKKICGQNPRYEIKYTKYFGCGAFYFVLSLFILSLKIFPQPV